MDIGKILQERASFPAYRKPTKRKHKRWGVFPSVIVDQQIFKEEDVFKCKVSLYSWSLITVAAMKFVTIETAAEGFKKPGTSWQFWCHAANNEIKRITLSGVSVWLCEINFSFKVRI